MDIIKEIEERIVGFKAVMKTYYRRKDSVYWNEYQEKIDELERILYLLKQQQANDVDKLKELRKWAILIMSRSKSQSSTTKDGKCREYDAGVSDTCRAVLDKIDEYFKK
uniref:Uncharacterized protein n=1 Tax=viral metagenome TaxID=1070528 RepID=A0A6M3JLM9_9ZZZZ